MFVAALLHRQLRGRLADRHVCPAGGADRDGAGDMRHPPRARELLLHVDDDPRRRGGSDVRAGTHRSHPVAADVPPTLSDMSGDVTT